MPTTPIVQPLPALLAKLEERFGVVRRNRRQIGHLLQSSSGKPLDVALFGAEDVPDQVTDGVKAAVTVGGPR